MKLCSYGHQEANFFFRGSQKIDLVDYLFRLGFFPSKIRNDDYWYLSPLRVERTPSFKVSRKLNRWYDNGLGKGGNLIDFAFRYHDCSVSELLQKLSNNFSFHQPLTPISSSHLNEDQENKIKIISEGSMSSFSLLRYLQQRRISPDIAEQFCREVKYQIKGKEYFGIGFKNNSGGYEIRNPYFKASSSPKDITTFNNGAKNVAVFEGFMDFLSFMVIHKNEEKICADFVVLNSVSFFAKARQFMEEHEAIRLYLDRDTIGQNYSRYALSLNDKYKDENDLYKHHKDLNDWLVNFGKEQKKKLGNRL